MLSLDLEISNTPGINEIKKAYASLIVSGLSELHAQIKRILFCFPLLQYMYMQNIFGEVELSEK